MHRPFFSHVLSLTKLKARVWTNTAIWAAASGFQSPCTVLPLRLTAHHFQSFILRYQVDASLFPILFTVGDAPHPVERGGCNFASSYSGKTTTSDLQYCTYNLQYIEENKRSKENPWSVRHLGVYHHRDPLSEFDLWVFLCPTLDGPVQRMLDALQQCDQDTLRELCNEQFRFHMLLNNHYSSNMQWYLRILGNQIENQVMQSLCFDLP